VPVRFQDPGQSIVHVIIYNALLGLTYVPPTKDKGMAVERSAAKILFPERKLRKSDADDAYSIYAGPLI